MLKELKGLIFTISSIVIVFVIWLIAVGLSFLLDEKGERYLDFILQSIPLFSLFLAVVGLVLSVMTVASKQSTLIVRILSVLSVILAIPIILFLMPLALTILVQSISAI